MPPRCWRPSMITQSTTEPSEEAQNRMENLELAVQAVKEAFPGMKLLEQEPMSAHSSFRIGGPARVIAFPQDVTSFSRLCSILKEHHVAPFILGNGTNILFPDEGLQDLFIVSTENLQKLFLQM